MSHALARIRGRVEVGLCATAIAFVAAADYATGADIDLSLMYLVPVALATWRISRASGMAMSLLSAAVSVAVDLTLGRYRLEPVFLLWNGGVQVAFLLVAVFAVDRIGTAERAERWLRTRLEDAYRRLDREMQLAGDVQHGLLPSVVPEVPGHRIAAHYATCARAGGDYYDFFPLRDGRLGILIADASGHGPSAAVIMATARALLRGLPEHLESPEALLESVNRRLAGIILEPQFVTACYAVLDPKDESLTVALAGHPRPILVRATGGAPEDLGAPPGLPLGMEPVSRYSSARIRLEPGDFVVLYTDGLVETLDPAGTPLGEEAVYRCLAGARGLPPEPILVRLEDVMRHHRGTALAADDVTVLVVRRGFA